MTQADAAMAGTTGELTGTTKYRIALEVDIQDVGPCRKHVRVKVPRADIDHFELEAVQEVAKSAAVPGFRKGKVPSGLAKKRFAEEISDSVRQQVLMLSLEQLAEDNSLDPINEPDFDVQSLTIPTEGDFEYEFDIEVRPDFEIPNYSGLKIQRPIRDVTEQDITVYLDKVVTQYASLVDHDGPAEAGDFVVSSIDFSRQGKPYRGISAVELQLKPTIRFRDAEISGLDQLLAGSTRGTVKSLEVVVSNEAEQFEMRGETLLATITVGQVKRQQLPEMNTAFYERIGYANDTELRDEVEGMLRRQVMFEQRQACRRQVLEQITVSATWDLPETLVSKQTENALRREVLEMQEAGFTTQQILARENELRQKSISSTRQALKEHFVLNRIATTENIEVTPIDIDSEINMIAVQRGESPRRVRARMQKSGVIENLEAQIRERKAVDFILRSAQFEDVPTPTEMRTDDIQALTISICGMSSVVVDPNDEEEKTSV